MAKTQVAKRRPNVITRLLKETTGELRKVTWPTKQDATQLTILVLIVVLISSALLGVLDLLFSRFIAMILALG